MGQYLALGLTHQIFTSLETIQKYSISDETLRREIERSLLFDMNLFREEKDDRNVVFTLKADVIKEGMIPFLEKLYPIVYTTPTEHNKFFAVLERLRSTMHDEWLSFAREKSNHVFQMDDYVEPRHITIPVDFRPNVCLHFRVLMLYVGYGKIVTEGVYDFTDFFKYCIHETFRDYPIARAAQVYITG